MSDVAQAANSGSYHKALALARGGAVSILIRCADGATEASVRSEQRCNNDQYTVRVAPFGDGKISAKCSCVDHKKRGGLCK
eukprot:CAMPEP_0179312282 /NCGR_PEP_ID=MMETSP0797-20121207/53173_1 /TAXON_ID=47934 /ORGANISM="Dinophysis acuminata, Strain DAEP01" /LENGTH=80 /DNA_ID=CAMNT_0021022185 /DNA_START=28 /DNA_END=267 /DNA_ORIENTATION=-